MCARVEMSTIWGKYVASDQIVESQLILNAAVITSENWALSNLYFKSKLYL
jgi:hypothetical protein